MNGLFGAPHNDKNMKSWGVHMGDPSFPTSHHILLISTGTCRSFVSRGNNLRP